MKLVYQYVIIFCNFLTTSSHLRPLQVENCGSNSRLVVDEDDNDKFRIERVNKHNCVYLYVFKFLRASQSIFATTYHICNIHSSYLISGFGAGNIFLNILLMLVDYTLSRQHLYFQSIQFFYGSAT